MLIAQFEKLFCIDRGIGPCNFTYVNKTFNTRKYFKECTIVFNVNNTPFDNFTFFNILRQHIPWMRSQLFQAKTNSLFLVIKIQHHNIDLLIKLQYFSWMRNTPP